MSYWACAQLEPQRTALALHFLELNGFEVIRAVRELVEAVVILNCFVDHADEAPLNEQPTVARAFDVLREILATPELSSLHPWAKKLLTHAEGFDADEGWWLEFNRWKDDFLRGQS